MTYTIGKAIYLGHNAKEFPVVIKNQDGKVVASFNAFGRENAKKQAEAKIKELSK